jgi:hypothetical protein
LGKIQKVKNLTLCKIDEKYSSMKSNPLQLQTNQPKFAPVYFVPIGGQIFPPD